MTFAGLDVHARSTHVAALEVASGELKRIRFGPGSEEVIAWLAALPPPRLEALAVARPRLPGTEHLDAGAPALAFAPALRAASERARLPRLPRGRRRPRRPQAGAR